MLYVVRHGETDWNRAGRLQGRIDVPLNDTGVTQARALARYFEDRRLSRVLTSPLSRATMTAAAIAGAAACPCEEADELVEIHHGVWQGLTIDHIQARDPQLWTRWNSQPSSTQPPGAECLRATLARVDGLLQRLTPGEDTCLVTHGVISQAIIVRLTGMHPDDMFTIAQSNGCVNLFEIGDTGRVATALNITTHLQMAVVGRATERGTR